MSQSPSSAPDAAALPSVRAFNHLPTAEVVALLRECADVPAWALVLESLRPFADAGALLGTAGALAAGWTDAEVREALRAHPRIGEGTGAGGQPMGAASRREQAGVAAADAERWRQANAAYEEKFGEVFLIRAAGRDSEQMLAELDRRLRLDPVAERAERREQLRQIAMGRLRATLAALPVHGDLDLTAPAGAGAAR